MVVGTRAIPSSQASGQVSYRASQTFCVRGMARAKTFEARARLGADHGGELISDDIMERHRHLMPLANSPQHPR